jgi:hypothetical protein
MSEINNSLFFYPTPAPTHILGSVDYYEFRYQDFLNRFPDEIPPQYYMEYGDKYVKKFTDVLYNRLSDTGKLWMIKTRLELQLEIEHALCNDPQIEFKKNEFKDFTFESHAKIYKRTGVMELSLLDRLAILMSMDIKDLFGEIGWQAIKVGLYCHNYQLNFSSSLR